MGKTKCKRKVQHSTHHFPWTFAVHGKCGCVLLWTKKRRRNRASRDGLHQSDNLNRKPADGKWSASQRHRKQWFILFKQGRFHTNSWHLQNVFLTGMSLINWEKIQMLLTRYLACFGWVILTDWTQALELYRIQYKTQSHMYLKSISSTLIVML